MHHTIRRCLLILPMFFLMSVFGGCNSQQTFQEEFYAMDTYFTIKYSGASDEFGSQFKETVVQLEHTLSATDADSTLSALNRTGSGIANGLLKDLLLSSVSYSNATDGYFSPYLGNYIQAWGFTTDHFHVPTDSELAEIAQHQGTPVVSELSDDSCSVDLNGVLLDLGGIAKGYTADEFARQAKEAGITEAFANLGGMVCAVGLKNGNSLWKVGISDGEDNGILAIMEISDLCVSPSGSYQRFFTENGVTYHHILDPYTGKPAESDLFSVTVINSSGTMADAYSTALYVMGTEKGVVFCKEHDITAVFVTSDRRIVTTCGADKLITEYKDDRYTVINESIGG